MVGRREGGVGGVEGSFHFTGEGGEWWAGGWEGDPHLHDLDELADREEATRGRACACACACARARACAHLSPISMSWLTERREKCDERACAESMAERLERAKS